MDDIRYLTEHYDEKIEKIKAYNAPLNFIFITDQHNRLNEYITTWDKTKRPDEYEKAENAIRSMQYIIDRVPNIQCVVSGGDIGCDYHPDPDKIRESYKQVMDAFYELSVPTYCCVGNHDDALTITHSRKRDTIPRIILPDEMHKICMKHNPTKENYFYIDFENQGYRFIFLNTSDHPFVLDENGQYEDCEILQVSNKQAEWFENEALDTDLRIIVFCHAPIYHDNLQFGSHPYNALWNGGRIYHALKNKKNAIMTVHGDVHYDNLLYDPENFLTVTTLCSLTQKWHPTCPDRELGTITETAFDVFSIKGNIVYITRFGAGQDRIGQILRG